jgi:hypothetical protein
MIPLQIEDLCNGKKMQKKDRESKLWDREARKWRIENSAELSKGIKQTSSFSFSILLLLFCCCCANCMCLAN